MRRGDGVAAARHWQALCEVGPIGDWSDRDLVNQFLISPGASREAAFAALVERHGPMVLAVGRGVLGRGPDAEDAFQATFLVLARSAGTFRFGESIGPWLFQVARRTALGARRARLRRQRLDGQIRPRAHVEPTDPEVIRVIHEEIDQLADRDRAVVVLCDLEGESLDTAARRLGCPVGTIKSRLARARERLRRSLQRRGLGTGAVGPLFGTGGLESISSNLIERTTTTAIRFATWSPLATSVAVRLAQGVIRTMTLRHWVQSGAVALGSAVFLTVGSAWVAVAGPQAPAPGSAPAPAPATSTSREPATVEVKAMMTSSIVDEQVGLVAPKGVDLVVNPAVATTVLKTPAEGQKIKKGDILFQFDEAPLRRRIAELESNITQGEYEIPTQRTQLHEKEDLVKQLVQSADARWQEAEAKRIKTEHSAVDRAEGRVKRYRDAVDQANSIRLDAVDTSNLPALVARLTLMDRLDEAEAELATRQREFEKIQADAPKNPQKTDEKLEAAIEERDRLNVQLASRIRKLEKNQQIRDNLKTALDGCTVRSEADGYFRSTHRALVRDTGMPQRLPSLSPTTLQVQQKIDGERYVGRIVESAEPTRELTVFEQTGGLANLAPESAVLFRGFADQFNRRIPGPAISGKLIRHVRTTDKQGSFPGTGFAVFLLDKPVDADVAAVGDVEYRASQPSGMVKVPKQAVVKAGEVAIRLSDGKFQWREVEVNARFGDEVIVSKMLAVGEVIALDPWAAMGEVPPPAEPELDPRLIPAKP